jgi:hypothetical protein
MNNQEIQNIRPVEIDKIFELSADILICLYGGIISPKLCENELKAKLESYDFLVSFDSTVGQDTHLSKHRYFQIISSNETVKEVGNTTCCLISIYAFENLKKIPSYRKIMNLSSVKFLYHLRNGSAHGNIFNFYGNGKFISPKQIIWNGKTIDASLQGKNIFPDFFSPGDIAYLLEDISKELKKHH